MASSGRKSKPADDHDHGLRCDSEVRRCTVGDFAEAVLLGFGVGRAVLLRQRSRILGGIDARRVAVPGRSFASRDSSD